MLHSTHNPAHILLVGTDKRLLYTRADVLLHFWSVTATMARHGSEPDGGADLVVLCHTVPQEQRARWIAGLRAASPACLIVVLDYLDFGPRNGADATVDHNRGPAALVSTIYELLRERGLGSKQWVAGGQTLIGSRTTLANTE